MIVGVTLTPSKHLTNNVLNLLNKGNKTTDLLKNLKFITKVNINYHLFKAFIRPHLDYGDIIYDKTYYNYFPKKLEPIQYCTCLTLIGALKTRKHIKNLVKSPFEFVFGKENFVFFIKS